MLISWRNRWLVGIIVGSLMLLAACGTGSQSTSPKDDGGAQPTGGAAQQPPAPAPAINFTPAMQQVIDKAKQEGEVSWYIGSGRRTAADEAKASQLFEEAMGFPMKIHFAASTGSVSQQLAKYQSDFKSGVKPQEDIFSSSGRLLNRLVQSNLNDPTDWNSLGISDENISDLVNGVFIWDNFRTLFYNTNMVKKEDLPQRWTDLLDPKWKGQIVTPSNPNSFPYVGADIGEDEMLDLLERLLKEQEMALVPTITEVPNRVASGEFAIGFSGTIADQSRKGAPIDFVPLKDRPGALTSYGVVMKDAPHPNAAKAFLYFLAETPQGIQMLDEIFGWTRHTAVNSEAWKVLGEGRGLFLELEWEVEHIGGMADKVGKLMRGE